MDYRHKFHIMPPKGWLNDPNGSCFFKGKYHIFFQYSPESPEGGSKCWGHYESEDLLHFNFTGTAIRPDSDADRGGAYSGTAFTDDGRMEIFYTGNVKHKGDYDYINEGREHNVIYVESPDGVHFSEKKVLLRNTDYPQELSCHVRDPKVFKENGRYKMILGARTKESEAALLVMDSEDKLKWRTEKLVMAPEGAGYMWECPDYFILDGISVLSVCPQGVETQGHRFQNVYQSGYFSGVKYDKIDADLKMDSFKEWDMGFDFYAPQTFVTADGRRVLIGWAGVPDSPYGNAPSVKEGWQHSMTLIRELSMSEGTIRQMPVSEYEDLREEELVVRSAGHEEPERNGIYINAGGDPDEYDTFETVTVKGTSADICFSPVTEDFVIPAGTCILDINGDIKLTYDGELLHLKFMNSTGCGRDERKAVCRLVRNVRILIDASLAEVYINDGETVFTTRYYPETEDLNITALSFGSLRAWSMGKCIEWENLQQ